MSQAGLRAAGGERQGIVARGFDAVVSVFNAGGSVWIFVIMTLLCADVAARFLFNSPVRGVPLLVEMSILMIVFLQLPAAIRSGRLTRSEILLARLIERRPSLGITLRTVYDALGLFLMCVVFYFTVPIFVRVWERDTFVGLESDFALPTWPFKLLILVGSSFCAIQFARGLTGGIRDLVALRREQRLEIGSIARMLIVLGILGGVLALIASVTDISNTGIGVISIVF
ncbi:MAG: TRAP transporter small permease subunit, partial [Rhodospirillaceae bacterium]